jgi:hypothetical protein
MCWFSVLRNVCLARPDDQRLCTRSMSGRKTLPKRPKERLYVASATGLVQSLEQ